MERRTTPDWSYWNACDLLQVWEAVALSINHDPSTITDYRKRLSNGRSGRPKWLFGGGEEFDRRMDLLKRAFDRDASQFVQPRDIYYALKHIEERDVLPEKIRQFFVAKGLTVPADWLASPVQESESPDDACDDDQEWISHAQRLAVEIRASHPKWNQERVGQEIERRFTADKVFTSRGIVPSAAYIIRHGMQKRGTK